MRNIGHAAGSDVVDWYACGVVAHNAASISPHVHVPDRTLTAVMNVDPQHLAGPAKPLDLHLCDVSDGLSRELVCLLPVGPSLLRIRPGGSDGQAYHPEREKRCSVSGDLSRCAEDSSEPKADGKEVEPRHSA